MPIEQRSVQWHFDPEFQGHARSPFDPRAEDVLGALPTRFRFLPSPFFSTLTITHLPDLLPDAAGLPCIAVTVQNWPTVRTLLEVGRELVIRHCQELLYWIESRSSAAVDLPVPDIRFETTGARGNAVLRVTMLGASRCVELTRTELHALRELKARGVAAIDRGKKAGLIKKLPELDPHLSSTSELRLTKDTASAEYRLADVARRRLDLDDA